MGSVEKASELHTRGLQVFQTQQNADEAIRLVEEALRLVPQEAGYLSNLGRLYAVKQDWKKAKELWEKALSINPQLAVALLNLGTYYTEHGDFKTAKTYLDRALQIAPDQAEIYIALGHREMSGGEIETAYLYYEKAVALAPDQMGFVQNLGASYERAGKFAEAIGCYEKVIRADPHTWESKVFAGIIALLHGQYETGWTLFEARLNDRRLYSPENYWKSALPENLKNKKVYIMGDQGFGDNFQFIRFAKTLKDRGAQTAFIGDPAILSLMKRIPFVDEVHEELNVDSGSIIVPAMSLPFILKIFDEKEFLAESIPYIFADPEKIKSVSKEFQGQKTTLGICWRGNPQHKWNRFRSLPLETFIPILEKARIDNTQVFSLQKPPYTEQEKEILNRYQVKTLALENFEETAAVIHHLDRVLSVDTSVAHLSAAMGKPTDIWVHKIPDWRWKTEGEKSAWYPNVRILRGQVN